MAQTYNWIHDQYWVDRATRRRRQPAHAHRWVQPPPRLVALASAPEV
jgi:hypothetical protein